MIKIKRVYEKPENEDGFRILVDRLWPRGLTKEKAGINLWLRNIAPSDHLRKWFGHDPRKWQEFKKRYFQELKSKTALVKTLKDNKKSGTLTLVFGAKDTEHINAVALKEYLEL